MSVLRELIGLIYDLQTDHYVFAFIAYGDGFENPYYFGDGGCDESQSDCTIGGGYGPLFIAVESIYVGSTLAHQLDIAMDGSVPALDYTLYDNFFTSVPPQYPVGPTYQTEIRAWFTPLAALTAFINPGSGNAALHPIPFIVELGHTGAGANAVPLDKYGQPNPPALPVAFPPEGERQRTYTLIGSDGRPWPDAPVVVKETFSNRVGPGTYPPADGYWFRQDPDPNHNGYSGSAVELTNLSQMTDHYALAGIGFNPPVGFIQYYYATSFVPPIGMLNLTLPGVVSQGAVAPLWIRDEYNTCKNRLSIGSRMLPGQTIWLGQSYTGFDGDGGPPPSVGCLVANF